MKIAVAGGTGFVGRYVTKALISAGHRVTVLSRSPEKIDRIPQLRGAGSERIDVTQPSSLNGKLTGFEAVVNAVQLPNYPIEQPRKGLTFDRYDRGGTENLVEEAVRCGVERFVYLSGAGADMGSPKSWYRAKGRAEAAIRRAPVRHLIIRPSWAYGAEDRALNKFVAIARFSPVVPRFGLRAQRIQPVYVEDVALAIQRGFERDEAWGQTFEIGGPQVMSMTEVIKTMAEAMGKRRLVLPVPLPLAKLGTAPLVLLPTPPMTPGGVEFAAQDGLVDAALTQRVLDVHPMGFREGLARYLTPKGPRSP